MSQSQTQIGHVTTSSNQLIPLGFCRVIADGLRRILNEQGRGTSTSSESDSRTMQDKYTQ